MADPDVTTAAQRATDEVIRLHSFYAAWYRGETPDTDETFNAAVAQALTENFRLVSPVSSVRTRHDVLTAVRRSYGYRRGADFRMWTQEHAVQALGEHAVVVYTEWQSVGEELVGRRASALLALHLPERTQWLHVHETWIPGYESRALAGRIGARGSRRLCDLHWSSTFEGPAWRSPTKASH